MPSWRNAQLITGRILALPYIAHSEVCVVNVSFFLLSMSLFRRNEWHSAGAQINSAWYSTRVQRTSMFAVIIVTWPADARDLTYSDVTQGSEDGMTTNINVGIDPVFATKYSRWHLCFSFSVFFLICIVADQYSSALGNGLSSLAYECTYNLSLNGLHFYLGFHSPAVFVTKPVVVCIVFILSYIIFSCISL